MYGSQAWVEWFISLVDEIQFMLISSHHICIRSMAAWVLMQRNEEGLAWVQHGILHSYENLNQS